MFLFFKTKRDITPSLKTSRVTFLKVLIINAGPCGYFNAISEKHLRYSLFVKRIIAIEVQLYFLAWSDFSPSSGGRVALSPSRPQDPVRGLSTRQGDPFRHERRCREELVKHVCSKNRSLLKSNS